MHARELRQELDEVRRRSEAHLPPQTIPWPKSYCRDNRCLPSIAEQRLTRSAVTAMDVQLLCTATRCSGWCPPAKAGPDGPRMSTLHRYMMPAGLETSASSAAKLLPAKAIARVLRQGRGGRPGAGGAP